MAPSKLAPRFNPNKPHGTVHGDPRLAYDQNGIFYNGQAQAVDVEGKRIPMEEGPPIVENAARKGQAIQGPKPRDIDPEDETEDEKPLNLVAWRDGKLPGTLWPLVVANVKAQLGRAPSSKVEAFEMINNKWPPEDQEPENQTEAA